MLSSCLRWRGLVDNAEHALSISRKLNWLSSKIGLVISASWQEFVLIFEGQWKETALAVHMTQSSGMLLVLTHMGSENLVNVGSSRH